MDSPQPTTPTPDEQTPSGEHTITLAVTGASGSVYAVEMLRCLSRDVRVRRINLILSEHSRRVLAEELGNGGGRAAIVERLLGGPVDKVQLLADDDIGASIASGSYPTTAMVVLPCSMGTLAAVSNGLAATLIQRAADVALKQQRPLVLCVRETPFNRIHLRNMLVASEAGATIFPAIPTLYNRPESTTEMAQNFVHRVLAFVGLPQPGAYVWKPD